MIEETDERTSILLVDDHVENLVALEAVLEPLGQNLVRASSAGEALRQLIHGEFAVILLDVQMPEMDGFEAAALIRKRKQTQHTPIIFITANNQSDRNIAQGYSAGAIDYILKPFDPYMLRAKVSAFVDLARNTKALHQEIARRKQAEDAVRQLNADLERRVKERTAVVVGLNRTLQHLLRETHHRVKNNLQLLSAMIDLMVTEDSPTVDCERLDRLAAHVRALGFVHELITEATTEHTQQALVPVDLLLLKIITLVQQMKKTDGRYVVHSQLEHLLLPARESTTLAIIADELIANAIKHGRGEVDVSFSVSDGRVALEVCDDGEGFAEGFSTRAKPLAVQHGLQFVENLVRHDLGGSVGYQNRKRGGTKVTISMPLPKVESD